MHALHVAMNDMHLREGNELDLIIMSRLFFSMLMVGSPVPHDGWGLGASGEKRMVDEATSTGWAALDSLQDVSCAFCVDPGGSHGWFVHVEHGL